MEWLEQIQNYHGPPLVLALLIFLGTMISEDVACIIAGILAAKGWLPFPLAVSATALGIYGGDLSLYGLGRLSQKSKRHWRWLDRLASDERIERGRRLFDRYGTRWIFLSRFLPGSRLPSYVAAGAVKWSFPRFAIALGIAVVIWTPILVGIAYFSGQKTIDFLENYHKWTYPILFILVLVLVLIIKIIVPLFSWQGRRILLGKWRRLTHFEYWSPAIVYPLALWPLFFRRLQGKRTLDFLLCNPCMPLSGFAMESKGDILENFTPPNPERIRTADFLRFQNDGIQAVDQFAQKYDYPLVLKPDVGERGSGVSIIRSREEAKNWLQTNQNSPAMVQEYIPGLEVGIHWAREPKTSNGHLTSLARKLPQHLTGNGHDSLERLLLKDVRAAAMAHHFLKQFAAQLDVIPAAGEKIVLTELGTHCLGAIFEDARSAITPELTETIDQAGLCYPGFHFGRYDIRFPNEESLKQGQGLVILELNGVTGEPAHIYQPNYPFFRAIQDLRSHYHLASEIGRQLREQGQEPATWRELLHVIRAHRESSTDSISEK